jgi:hypothetical protein
MRSLLFSNAQKQSLLACVFIHAESERESEHVKNKMLFKEYKVNLTK